MGGWNKLWAWRGHYGWLKRVMGFVWTLWVAETSYGLNVDIAGG